MRLKKIVAGILAAVLMIGIFPTSAFANLELSDSEQAFANLGSDTVTNAWRYRSGNYGYWGTTSLWVLYSNS